MRFSELKPGMVVKFDHFDPDYWYSLTKDYIINPNFVSAEQSGQRDLGPYMNKMLRVKKIGLSTSGPVEYPTLYIHVVETGARAVLNGNWWNPADTNAFTLIRDPASLNEEIRQVPVMKVKKAKDIVMGELKAMPGAVDYEAAELRFKAGRSRKRKVHRRKTRKVRKH